MLRPRGTSHDCCYQDPRPHGEPLLTNTSAGDPPTLANEEAASKRQEEVKGPMAHSLGLTSVLNEHFWLRLVRRFTMEPGHGLNLLCRVASSMEASSHFANGK